MNGEKSKINKGFRALFRIPSVKRKPVRERVTALQVRVRQLPATTVVVKAREDLEKAADQAFGKLPINDDKARQAAVTEAERLCTLVELAIKDLKPIIPKGDKGTGLETTEISKKDKKENDERAKALLKDLKGLQTQIEKMQSPKPPTKRVLMSSNAWSVTTLLGEITRLELAVASLPVTPERDTQIRAEMLELNKTIGDAQHYANEANSLAASHESGDGVVVRATQALDKLGKLKIGGKKVEKVDELPLAQLLSQLNAALNPGQMLNPAGVQALVEKLEKELLAVASEEGAKAYVTDSQAQAEAKRKVAAFDKLVNGELEKLRLLAQPLRLPELLAATQEVQLARISLSKPVDKGGTDKTPEKMAEQVLKDIAKCVETAKTEITKRGRELEQLRRDLNGELDRVKDTRAQPIFTSEWLLINSTMDTINQLWPEETPPIEQLVPLLTTLKPLVQQVTERVKVIETSQGSYATFGTDLTKLEEDIKAAGKQDAPLKTWDDKSLTEMKTSLDKLKKGLTTAPAASSFKAWDKLKKDFDEKNKAATDVDNYWGPKKARIRQISLNYTLLMSGLDGLVAPSTPNAVAQALDAVDAAKNARPVVLDTLKSAVEHCLSLCGSGSSEAVYQAAEISHKKVKADQDEENEKKKAAKSKLTDRYYGVDKQVSLAASLVKAAKGETAPVDRIKDLLKKAKEQIEAGDGDAAEKTMDLIIRRIGLIQAHPEGEPARNRKELGTLNQEWVDVRTKARVNLNVVLDKIEEHMNSVPDPTAKNRITELGRALTAYRATFTEGANPLMGPLSLLADENTPDAGKRQAREEALATVGDLQRGLQAHPLTVELAKAPLPAARAVPASLMRVLDRLQFTVLTSVG